MSASHPLESREARDEEDRRDLAACQSGDPASLERLYRRHAAGLMGFARRMLRRAEEAEDVVQETFLSVWRGAAPFRGESSGRSWLFSIALNACRLRLRARSLGPTSPLDPDLADRVEETDPSPEVQAVRRSLEAMPPEDREILLLSVQDLPYTEMGRVLSLSEAQVRGRLYRARKGLQASLRALGRDDV